MVQKLALNILIRDVSRIQRCDKPNDGHVLLTPQAAEAMHGFTLRPKMVKDGL